MREAEGGRGDLLAHDLLELALAQPTLAVTQPPAARDAEEVGVGHMQLGMEGLRPTSFSRGMFTTPFERLQGARMMSETTGMRTASTAELFQLLWG